MTADIPESMSEVIGNWWLAMDFLPVDIRTGAEWKALLPQAAGTGRWAEPERLACILDWMWKVVLPSLQPIADAQGFGGKMWRMMCTDRANTDDVANHAFVYGEVERFPGLSDTRAAAVPAAIAVKRAGFAEDCASSGDYAGAALEAGCVAFAAGDAHGAASGINAAYNAAAAAAEASEEESRQSPTQDWFQEFVVTGKAIKEAAAAAYDIAYPAARATYWRRVQPEQLLLQLSRLGRS